MTEPTGQPGPLDSLPSTVLEVEGLITSPKQLEAHERLTRLRDDSWVVHEVIQVWREQSDSERNLRKVYASAMLVALCVETVFASTVFVLLGASALVVPQWVANVFFTVVFGQIAAGTLAITRYLFPPGRGDALVATLLELRHLPDSGHRKTPRRAGRK